MRRAAIAHSFLVATLIALPLGVGCGGGGSSTGPPPDDGIPLERFDAGFFSIQKPKGWTVTLAGHCSTLAFLIHDPVDPARQIFYFGTVGPVYLNEQQRAIDEAYMRAGGFSIPWVDAPAVDPLTPQNYLAHWPQIAAMDAATAFMAGFPRLQDLTVVAAYPQANLLPGASTAQLRALFTQDGAVAEGMFLATVLTFAPFTGIPGQGTAYGYIICGVTAPKEEFAASVDDLVRSLESFTITRDYVDACLIESAKIWGAIAEAGRTLSEASDILYEGWQQRSHAEDILAEQRTDAFRGVERVYDPDTGQVYTFPAGWYEDYDRTRSQYDMSDLQLLPDDDWSLWMASPLDGPSRFH
jgi:hypothetical protein